MVVNGLLDIADAAIANLYRVPVEYFSQAVTWGEALVHECEESFTNV